MPVSEQQTHDAAPLDQYAPKPMDDYYSDQFSHHGSAVIAQSEQHHSKEQEHIPFTVEKNLQEEDQYSNSQKNTD